MVDGEDNFFWEEAIKDVKPLQKDDVVVGVKKIKSVKSKPIRTVPLKFYKHDVGLGVSSDIDRNTMRRFKREEFPIEGRLDLHGYTEDRAFHAVHEFITSSYLSGKRCVLIVTGKGLNHVDEDVFAFKGVLKKAVPRWLKEDNLRQLILSYIHPSEKLGGAGALYILLRRHRH